MFSGVGIETTTITYGYAGDSFYQPLQAWGGKTPYTWKKVGKLPKGLKLSKTGVLSGTLNKRLAEGNYSVTVKVTDSSRPKTTATATFTLTVY